MYPYGNGETFLTQELDEISKIFDSVFILPNHQHQDKRELPKNVKLIDIKFESSASISSTFLKNPSLLVILFYEIIYSKHRFTYIKQYKQYLINIAIAYNQTLALKEKLDIKINDTLYSYWLNDWAIRLSILKKWYFKKINLISRIHGYDFDEIQTNNVFHPLRNFVLSQYNKIVSVSDYGKHYVQKKYPKFKNKIFTSYLGNKSSISNLIESKEYVLVSCSNIIHLKRLDIIIDILQHIELPINWIHFGTGELELSLKEKAQILPSNIKVDWKGHVSNDKILEFYSQNAVSLFINTSDYEGLPYSMIEAINYGIPICGRNICGIPEIVNDQTGILLEKEIDSKNSANLISDFLMNKSKDQLFRIKVKESFETHFNSEKNYKSFIQNYLIN